MNAGRLYALIWLSDCSIEQFWFNVVSLSLYFLKMKKLIILYFLSCAFANAQNYTIDARLTPNEILSAHLKMGNPGPAGKEIIINNKYMTLGGTPIIPVMGEFHFSRFPREQWEDIILKMKANGINIIATYVLDTP